MKLKPVIFIIITLVIGFVIGMLTSAQIRYQKLKPVRMYFSEDRFREGLYKVIQPDEKQKAEIEVVLEKYARINSELQGSFRRELDANMKAFRKEIDQKLTRDQLARLKEMDEKRQEMIRQNRRNRQNDSTDGHFDRRRGGRPYDGPPPPGGRGDSTGRHFDSTRYK